MELTARVHREDGSYWAEVVELPGLFVSGESIDEIVEALGEAIPMYLEDASPVKSASRIEVEEIKVATSAILSPA